MVPRALGRGAFPGRPRRPGGHLAVHRLVPPGGEPPAVGHLDLRQRAAGADPVGEPAPDPRPRAHRRRRRRVACGEPRRPGGRTAAARVRPALLARDRLRRSGGLRRRGRGPWCVGRPAGGARRRRGAPRRGGRLDAVAGQRARVGRRRRRDLRRRQHARRRGRCRPGRRRPAQVGPPTPRGGPGDRPALASHRDPRRHTRALSRRRGRRRLLRTGACRRGAHGAPPLRSGPLGPGSPQSVSLPPLRGRTPHESSSRTP